MDHRRSTSTWTKQYSNGYAVQRHFTTLTRQDAFTQVLMDLEASVQSAHTQEDLIQSYDLFKGILEYYELPCTVNNVQHNIDYVALDLYPTDADYNYTPVNTAGDGNCLYRAASIGICGEDTLYMELRTRTVLEMIHNIAIYTNETSNMDLLRAESEIVLQNYAPFSANSGDYNTSDPIAIMALYIEDIKSACQNRSWGNAWHMAALASAIHRPIVSIYPQYNARFRHLFNRTFEPLQNDGLQPIHIMWSRCSGRSGRQFQPDHFVACLLIGSHRKQRKQYLTTFGSLQVHTPHGKSFPPNFTSPGLKPDVYNDNGYYKGKTTNVTAFDKSTSSHRNYKLAKQYLAENPTISFRTFNSKFPDISKSFYYNNCTRTHCKKTPQVSATKRSNDFLNYNHHKPKTYKHEEPNRTFTTSETTLPETSTSDLTDHHIKTIKDIKLSKEDTTQNNLVSSSMSNTLDVSYLNQNNEGKEMTQSKYTEAKHYLKQNPTMTQKDFSKTHETVSERFYYQHRTPCTSPKIPPDMYKAIQEDIATNNMTLTMFLLKYPKFTKNEYYEVKKQITAGHQHTIQNTKRKEMKTLAQFRRDILIGPTAICSICNKTCYPHLGVSSPNLDIADYISTPPNDPKNTWVCNRCHGAIFHKKMPYAAAINNLHTTPIPLELSILNSTEKRLICRVQPFMRLMTLRYGQHALLGQAINFTAPLIDIIDELPRNLSTYDTIFIKGPKLSPDKSVVLHEIRPAVILDALNWLKKNNPHYEDVSIIPVSNQLSIDDACITEKSGSTLKPSQSIYDDNNDTNVLEHNYTDRFAFPTDFILPDTNIGSNLTRKKPVIELQKISTPPISLYNDIDIEGLSFPWLFPTGVGTFKSARPQCISFLKYAQSKLLHKDNRYQNDVPYLFHTLSHVTQHLLNMSISIAVRQRSNLTNLYFTNTETHEPLNAQLFKSPINIPSQINEHCWAFLKSIRGTSAFWRQVKLDLFAQLAHLGAPTWFVTLSANDHHWSDLYTVLAKTSASQNIIHPDNLTNSQKAQLLATNPITAARHFQHRFQTFFNTYLRKEQALGKITDFFYRIEWQDRGSPHVHMLLWTANAPVLEYETDTSKIATFIDKYCSVKIPDKDIDPELHHLVTTCQQHRHTQTCQKKSHSQCRFNYPRPQRDLTTINNTDTTDIYNCKRRFYDLQRQNTEIYINAYNPTLLRAWAANLDVQLVSSSHATAQYISTYVAKSEPVQLYQTVCRRLKSLPHDSSIRKKLFTIGNTLLSHRLISAQEAAYFLAELPYKRSSRTTIFINSAKPNNRTRILKPKADIEVLDDKDQNIYMPNIFDKYESRPHTKPFSALTLYDFTSKYTTNKNKELICRQKPACIRTPNFTTERNGDDFYYSLLLLHMPWRNEQEIIQPYNTALDAFVKKQHLLQLPKDHKTFAQKVVTTITRLKQMELLETDGDIGNEDHVDNPQFELYNPQHFEADINSLDDNHYQGQNDNTYQTEDLNNTLQHCALLTDEKYQQLLNNMTPDQAEVFEIIKDFTKRMHAYEMGQNEAKPTPLRIFLSGPGGSGKTHILKIIREYVTRAFPTDSYKPAIMICATTGVAAFAVGGETLHKALKLPVQHKTKYDTFKLSDQNLHQLRYAWSQVKFFLIDEVSMMGALTFQQINQRLNEIMNTPDSYFGELNVIVIGDMYQLAPVRQAYVFVTNEHNPPILHLWRDLFTLHELRSNVRQSQDQKFADMLNRIRVGTPTIEDINTLKSRMPPHVDLQSPPFSTATRIYAKLKQCDMHNNKCLHNMNTKIYTIEARHRILNSPKYCPHQYVSSEEISKYLPTDHRDTAGLPTTLQLTIGAEVMLRRNISTSHGLTNGSTGTVIAILNHNTTLQSINVMTDLPTVYVKFHHDTKPHKYRTISKDPLLQGTVPISAVHSTFFGLCQMKIQRTQIPLLLNFAVSIHKVQGSTLTHAVLDLGDDIFSAGQSYVALSRVKTLSGLAITNLNPKKLYACKYVDQEMARLRKNTMKGCTHDPSLPSGHP
ncbi:uncharacterized protein LOC144868192 [Branchiostoma floridae x Branchiostoma japonicum]